MLTLSAVQLADFLENQYECFPSGQLTHFQVLGTLSVCRLPDEASNAPLALHQPLGSQVCLLSYHFYNLKYSVLMWLCKYA